jgi:hypothetical protein
MCTWAYHTHYNTGDSEATLMAHSVLKAALDGIDLHDVRVWQLSYLNSVQWLVFVQCERQRGLEALTLIVKETETRLFGEVDEAVHDLVSDK